MRRSVNWKINFLMKISDKIDQELKYSTLPEEEMFSLDKCYIMTDCFIHCFYFLIMFIVHQFILYDFRFGVGHWCS